MKLHRNNILKVTVTAMASIFIMVGCTRLPLQTLSRAQPDRGTVSQWGGSYALPPLPRTHFGRVSAEALLHDLLRLRKVGKLVSCPSETSFELTYDISLFHGARTVTQVTISNGGCIIARATPPGVSLWAMDKAGEALLRDLAIAAKLPSSKASVLWGPSQGGLLQAANLTPEWPKIKRLSKRFGVPAPKLVMATVDYDWTGREMYHCVLTGPFHLPNGRSANYVAFNMFADGSTFWSLEAYQSSLPNATDPNQGKVLWKQYVISRSVE